MSGTPRVPPYSVEALAITTLSLPFSLSSRYLLAILSLSSGRSEPRVREIVIRRYPGKPGIGLAIFAYHEAQAGEKGAVSGTTGTCEQGNAPEWRGRRPREPCTSPPMSRHRLAAVVPRPSLVSIAMGRYRRLTYEPPPVGYLKAARPAYLLSERL